MAPFGAASIGLFGNDDVSFRQQECLFLWITRLIA